MNLIDEILGTETEVILFLAGWEKRVSSKEALKRAWDDGKDFLIFGSSKCCSIRDIKLLNKDYDHICIRTFGIEAIKVN